MIGKVIGGYFELELINYCKTYHPNAIALNTGRNAFEYILKANYVKKIYIPYFTCDVLLEPLNKLKITYEFYHINEQLEPIFDFSVLKKNDFFLYTNYFGLKNCYTKQLSLFCQHLIVDNSQAFFSVPHNSEATFYSSRKFFGVADGAYLYCNKVLEQVFKKDCSYDRMSHLLIRKDVSAETGYQSFIENDEKLKNQPIKKMSSITEDILGRVDYSAVAQKRIDNYRFLENELKSTNKMSFQLDTKSSPMVYPYWTKDLTLRKRLIENKIYTATYWPNVKEWCSQDSLEFKLTNEVVYLPIDQRYGIEEMTFIIDIILNV